MKEKTADYWNEGILYLQEKDPIMKQIINSCKEKAILKRKNTAFEVLTNSIIGQQISTKAASSIRNRLFNLCDGKIEEEKILAFERETLLEIGLSNPKLNYIINVANFILLKSDLYFEEESYETIKKEMLQIKGVGQWTFMMFSMFYLLSPNEFPIKDLGILKSLCFNYNIEYKSKEMVDKIQNISKNWSPYNTIASIFLWAYLDNEYASY